MKTTIKLVETCSKLETKLPKKVRKQPFESVP